MTKFLNISTDNTLGGNSASDETVSSQKAIKSYVDGLKTDWYGTCSTGASTQAKVVSCTGFVLTTGVSIRVKFTNNQSYNGNPTLNVNGTGALSVKAYGTTNAARYYWRAGEVVAFTYDGSYWIMEDGATATTSYYGMTVLTDTVDTTATKALTPNGAYLALQNKQNTLVSGTNIKTINNTSLLGSGNITVDSLPSQTGQSGKFLTSNGTSASLGSALTSNDVTSIYTATGTAPVNGVAVSNAIAIKQDNLVSGTNIKTINGTSLLGGGNITIETSSTPNVDGTTISYNSSDALQTIGVINKNGGNVLPIWQGTEEQWNNGVARQWYYYATSTSAGTTFYAASTNGVEVAFGNNVFVSAIIYNKDEIVYSTDGINWTNVSLDLTNVLGGYLFFGNGTFFIYDKALVKCYYSYNGYDWYSFTPTGLSNKIKQMDYSNGKFCAVDNQNAYISDDGINWTSSVLPTITNNWDGIVYSGEKYVCIGNKTLVTGCDKLAYSTDGINWTLKTLSYTDYVNISFINGRYFLTGGSSRIEAHGLIYTDDLTNWNYVSFGQDGYYGRIIYGNNVLLLPNRKNGGNIFRSVDNGLTWTKITTISQSYGGAFGNDTFVVSNAETTTSGGLFYSNSGNSLTCYTLDNPVTQNSTIYSEPNVSSALTVSSVTTGAITLSDNNTYYYNQSGNVNTYQSVGVAHPDWLCFINGVGVKIGTTTIATA